MTEQLPTEPDAVDREAYEYDAFISYRRLDGSRAAQWIRQRALAYELPDELRDRSRPLRIYLDTSYETATDDFFANNIQPALEASRYLIVVCTASVAEAAHGGGRNWVQRELELFTALPQGRQVVPVEVSAHWNDVIPRDLRANLPRVEVIDLPRLRGWWGRLDLAGKARENLLKILAPLFAVERSEMPILREEEARNRQRRLRWIAGLSASVAVTLAALTVWAVLATRGARANLITSLLSQARALSDRRPASARATLVEAIQLAESGGLLSPDAEHEAHLGRVWLGQGTLPSPPVVLWHADRVTRAEFDAEGRRVVTASDDATAQVWDVATGNPIGSALQHGDPVMQASFSPDGQVVATASWDGSAQIWDAATGEPITDPMTHGEPLTSLDFSPDGMRLATGGWDDTARIWDVATGRELVPSMKTRFMCEDVAFSPSGRLLATASWGFEARLWDADDGFPIRREPLEHQDLVNTLDFSDDGRALLTACADGAARLWDVRSGRLFASPLVHAHGVTRAIFAPGQTAIATSSLDGTARIWRQNGQNWASVVLPHHGAVNWVAFDASGARVATADNDGTARLWSTVLGQPLGAGLEHAGPVNTVAFSPDGELLLTASDDGTARLWDLRYVAPVRRSFEDPDHRESPVNAAVVGGNGSWVAFGNNHHRLHIRSATTGETLTPPLEFDDIVTDIDISPDESAIAVACGDGVVRVMDTGSWEVVHRLNHGAESVQQVSWSQDGERLVSATLHGSLWIWKLTEPSTRARLVHAAEGAEETAVNDLAQDTSGCFVATAGADGIAHVWSLSEDEPVASFDEHGTGVTSIAFHPTEPLMASADDVGRVFFWDLTGVRRGPVLRHRGNIEQLEFHPDGEILLTASGDGTARMWSVATGAPVGKPMRHAHAVWAARFEPGGRLLATASQDRTVRLWDAATGESIGPPIFHAATVSGLAFDATGQWLVSEGSDGAAHLIQVAPAGGDVDALRHSIEQQTLLRWDSQAQDTRMLTKSEWGSLAR